MKSSARGIRWMRWAAVSALVALLVGGGVTWQAQRRGSPAPTAAPATDSREAVLLRAVQRRPADPRARTELAGYYLESGQPFDAIWELAVAQELGPADEALTARLAEALKQGGLPDVALWLLTEGGTPRPTGSVALQAARLCLEVAQPEAALALLRRGPALATSPEVLLLQAQAYTARGDLSAGRAAVSRLRARAAEQEPDAQVTLGRTALACGDRATTQELLAETARSHPEHEAAQYYAGVAFAASDRARAIEFFKQATRADPRKARAGVELGRLLYETAGRLEQAAGVYRQALRLEPQYRPAEEGLARTALQEPGETVYHQARVMELKERPDDALRLYRRWGKLRPERWDSVLRAAECWMDMERYVDAGAEVRRGLERFPDHPELYSHLVQILVRSTDRLEAVRICERWAAVDTETGRPEWMRGELAAAALRRDEAVRWYEAAVRKNPEFAAYHADLGRELAREADPERLRRARAELERAIALDPAAAGPHSQLGLVCQQMGDRESARRAFLRALDREPTRLDAWRGLMSLSRQLGHPRAAALLARFERQLRDRLREESAARRVLWRQPKSATARLTLARLLLRRGRLAEAQNHLEVAAEQPDGAAARPLLRRVERLGSVL